MSTAAGYGIVALTRIVVAFTFELDPGSVRCSAVVCLKTMTADRGQAHRTFARAGRLYRRQAGRAFQARTLTLLIFADHGPP